MIEAGHFLLGLIEKKSWVAASIVVFLVLIGLISSALLSENSNFGEDGGRHSWLAFVVFYPAWLWNWIVVMTCVVHSWIWQRKLLAVLILCVWPAAIIYAILVAWKRVPKFGYGD